jgi:hypothetical protein
VVAAAMADHAHARQEQEISMKITYCILTIACLAVAGDSYAQYTNDALRFSQTQSGSTSRFKAAGNTGTAVGGDLSSLGSNPAGIGLFTKSEFSLSPEYVNYSTKSSFLDAKTNAQTDKLNINHAGLVISTHISKIKGSDLSKGVLSFNFGIGYNKINDFSNNIIYSGTNPNNSIADFYSDQANNAGYGAPSASNPPTGTLERAAYEGYLIDFFNGKYVPDTDINNKETKSETRKGGQSEVDFAAGLNISNKVYLGAGFGIISLNYTSIGSFIETGHSFGYNSNYESNYSQNYNTHGTGVNGKLGIIFKPATFLRLGASLQTPSFYTINDSYSENINTHLSGGTNPVLNVTNDPLFYDFSYGLKTPAHYNIGASVFNNDIGFISGEVEFINYGNIRLSAQTNDDASVILTNNQEIESNFKNTVNFKVGGEFKATPQIMFRAGYNLLGDAAKNSTTNHFKTSIYSGGAGYRFNNYYIDIAYQRVSYNTEFQPYALNTTNTSGPAPTAAVNNVRNNIFFTVGALV